MMPRSIITAILLCWASAAHPASLTLTKLDLTGAEPGTKLDADAPDGDMTSLYLVDLNTGRIDRYDRGTGQVDPVPLLSGISSNSGLTVFGVAFHPDFGTTGAAGEGKYFVSYAENEGRNVSGRNILAEFTAGSATAREVLRIEHGPVDPSAAGRHVGSDIGFGPDGYLYMTTGDAGGSVTGPNPSQNVGDLNGAILRIDPLGNGAAPYSVPADNPDFGAGSRPELWAIGARNPFRGNFDTKTGVYYFGDVGEDQREEINIGAHGANYGWNHREGDLAGPNPAPGPSGLTDPIYAYPHGTGPFEGVSVVGGFVYRGPLTALDGLYFFGDFLQAYSAAVVDTLWSFDADGPLPPSQSLRGWSLDTGTHTLDGLVSFGTGADGSLYVLDFDGDVFEVTGAAIPLPATLPLLAAALALSAVLRRRRF